MSNKVDDSSSKASFLAPHTHTAAAARAIAMPAVKLAQKSYQVLTTPIEIGKRYYPNPLSWSPSTWAPISRAKQIQESIASQAQKAKKAITTPVEVGGGVCNVNPLSWYSFESWNPASARVKARESTDTLKKISGTASEILSHTERLGVKPAETPPLPPPARVAPAQEVKPVQNPPLPRSVTEPVDAKTLNRATDWNSVIEVRQKELSERLTRFITFYQMREICGIKDADGKKEIDTLKLLELVDRSYTQNRSLFKIFKEYYKGHKISWWQWFMAGFTYLVCRKTSLLLNTVDAYLGEGIKDVRTQLTDKGSDPTRTQFIQKFISRATEFFTVVWTGSAREFADAKSPNGTLDDYRKRAITKFYNNQLDELCRDFSKAIVNKYSPTVAFFSETWKAIPVFGYVFRAIEWAANKLIRSKMKSSILPPALVSAVKGVDEKTNPSNLPFAVAMTEFFTDQVACFNDILDSTEKSQDQDAPSPKAPPGTEGLSALVKAFQTAVKLDTEDHTALRQRLKAVDNPHIWDYPRDKVDEILEKQIVKGGNAFFGKLSDPNEANALLAKALEKTTKSLSLGKLQTPQQWVDEYNTKKAKLDIEVQIAVDKNVAAAIEDFVEGAPLQAEKVQGKSFRDQQNEVVATLSKIQGHAKKMTLKIGKSEKEPKTAHSIQAEVAATAQLLRDSSDLLLRLSQTEEIDKAGKKAIRSALNPILEEIEGLAKHMSHLQKFDRFHTQYADICEQLGMIQVHLETIGGKILSPVGLTQECVTMRRALGVIKRHITLSDRDVPPEVDILEKKTAHLEETLKELEKKHRIVQETLKTLLPPPSATDADKEKGLLQQLALGKKKSENKTKIEQLLIQLPDEEQAELRQLIGTGANLTADWGKVTRRIEELRILHADRISVLTGNLDNTVTETLAWTKETLALYKKNQGKNHAELTTEMTLSTQKIDEILKKTKELEIHSPWRVSGLGFLGGALGAGLVTYLAPLGWPLASATGALAGYSVTGPMAKKGIKAGANVAVQQKIMNTFHSTRKMFLSPHVYRAGLTWFMKDLSGFKTPNDSN